MTGRLEAAQQEKFMNPFLTSHLLGISYRKDKEFWFLPKIAGYFVTSLAVTVLLSTRSPGIQSLAASLVPSRTGIQTKGVRLTVYNIVYDTMNTTKHEKKYTLINAKKIIMQLKMQLHCISSWEKKLE